MKKIVFFILVAGMIEANAQGWQSKKCDSAIYLTTRYEHKKQYQSFTLGSMPITRQAAINRLNLYKPSAEEYSKYERARKNSYLFFAVGFPALIAGNIYGAKQNVPSGVLIGGTIVLMYTIEIPIFRKIKHMERSIDFYNRNVCSH